MGIIGGVESVRIDSYQPTIGDSVDITPNNTTRESKTGLTGYAGTSETKRPARISMQVFDDGTVDIKTLTALTNATVTVVTPLKTFVLRNAAQVEDVELAQADGTYTLVFEGPGPVLELS